MRSSPHRVEVVLIAILVFLVLVPVQHAQAACPPDTVCWTGSAGDGRWENGTNWSSGTVPGLGASVLMQLPFSGSPFVTISSQSMELYALTIGSGVIFTCTSTCTLKVYSAGASIANSGTITNLGTINVVSGGAEITNTGTIMNSGTLSVQGGSALLTNSAGGVIINYEHGAINVIGGGAEIRNLGTITNSGTLSVVGGGAFITNTNVILNCAGGTITGTLTGNPFVRGCTSNPFTTTSTTEAVTSEAALSSLGIATVDGVIADSEYTSCIGPETQGIYKFRFCEVNDNANLYLAFQIDDLTNDASTATGKADFLSIFFDNEADGRITSCAGGFEDWLALRASNVFGDLNICMSGSKLVEAEDTVHGNGVVKFTKGIGYVFEISHPLSSGDSRDFKLLPGNTLGYCVAYNDASIGLRGSEAEVPKGCVTPTSSGIASSYGKIRIAAGTITQPTASESMSQLVAGPFASIQNMAMLVAVLLILILGAFVIYRRRKSRHTANQAPSTSAISGSETYMPSDSPERTCPQCGSPRSPLMRFCEKCGADFSGKANASQSQKITEFSSDSRYVWAYVKWFAKWHLLALGALIAGVVAVFMVVIPLLGWIIALAGVIVIVVAFVLPGWAVVQFFRGMRMGTPENTVKRFYNYGVLSLFGLPERAWTCLTPLAKAQFGSLGNFKVYLKQAEKDWGTNLSSYNLENVKVASLAGDQCVVGFELTRQVKTASNTSTKISLPESQCLERLNNKWYFAWPIGPSELQHNFPNQGNGVGA